MHYPGGKAKTYHHIINLIPPHKVYIEPFLGLGSVMRAKKRAEIEIGIDLNKHALEMSNLASEKITLIHGNGMEYLESSSFEGHEVIYCDPPYYPSTRKRKRVYKYDFTESDHIRFLKLVTQLNARLIISGYDNATYRQYLRGWHLYTYNAKAHDGVRRECLWYNFPKPYHLHDYRYLGSNFRERETIRRRLNRLQCRLEKLSNQERSFILSWLNSKDVAHAS